MRNESKALRDVWEWKDDAYHDVEHLPTDEAIRRRLHDSLLRVKELGLPLSHKFDEMIAPRIVNQ